MKSTTHTCKATGCNRQVPKRYLMCREHWYQVPEQLRNEVSRTWADVQTSGQITIEYAKAVRDAIDNVGRTYPLDNSPQAQQVNNFD